ncbi:MAG: threonine ammonia-lyase, partial [Streptosporangiaceae bacterium]
MSDLVSIENIRAAARRIQDVSVRTPLVGFPGGDRDRPLLVKPESLQPTGAFKLRGAYATLTALSAEDRARGVVAHSSGNHAQAVAYAARALGVQAVIVMPSGAPPTKLRATRSLGAEVVLVGDASDERARRARELVDRHGYVLVPPYDDPRVIAGQGTVGLEIGEDAAEVDTVLVPVGGGGLIAGVATAVKTLRPAVRVVGVEPALAADARESIRAGERVAWPAERTGRTVADGLRVRRVGELPFAHMRRYVDDIVVVDEDEIRAAMRCLALGARLVAEPSGAVTTAAYLFRREELPGSVHVAVLSGGNADPDLLSAVLAEPA